MKPIFYALLLMSGCTLTANAREIATAPAADSILLEATAGDTLNLAVFGRYACDDARYAQLVERFNREDNTLTDGEIGTLYFGCAYRGEYSAADDKNNNDTWRKLMNGHQYGKAYKFAYNMLKTAPASPALLDFAIWAGKTRPEKELIKLKWRLNRIVECMAIFGDGTESHPLPVVNLTDEAAVVYTLLDINIAPLDPYVSPWHTRALPANVLVTPSNTNPTPPTMDPDKTLVGIHGGLSHTLVAVNGIPCDKLTFTPPVRTNLFSGSELWFNIALPCQNGGLDPAALGLQ